VTNSLASVSKRLPSNKVKIAMVKIRTYKRRINAMLRWYTEKVTEEVYGKIDVRTPAGFEVASRVLANLQKTRQAMEPMTPEWSIPVEVKVDSSTGMPNIFVSIPEQWEKDNLLYLDFDESWIRK
jgi:hypothetical protein